MVHFNLFLYNIHNGDIRYVKKADLKIIVGPTGYTGYTGYTGPTGFTGNTDSL